MDLGIIGGADGPTQILLTASPDWGWWIAGAAVILITAVWVIRRKKRSRS